MWLKKTSEGYIIKKGKKKYILLEGVTLGANYTSDLLFIVDENYNFVFCSCGANSFLEGIENNDCIDNNDWFVIDLMKDIEKAILNYEERSKKHD